MQHRAREMNRLETTSTSSIAYGTECIYTARTKHVCITLHRLSSHSLSSCQRALISSLNFYLIFIMLHLSCFSFISFFFFFNDTATTEIYTLSLHDALPIYSSHDQISYAVFCL